MTGLKVDEVNDSFRDFSHWLADFPIADACDAMFPNIDCPNAMVAAMFTAKINTPVSSSTPDTGSTRHAKPAIPSYATGSELTRSRHPVCSSTRLANISRELNRRIIPQK